MESGGGVGGPGAKPARPGSARPGGRPQSAVSTPGGPGLPLGLLPFYPLRHLFPGWLHAPAVGNDSETRRAIIAAVMSCAHGHSIADIAWLPSARP